MKTTSFLFPNFIVTILLDTFIHKNNMTTQRPVKRRRVGDVTCGQGEKVVRPGGNVLKRLLDNFKPFLDLEAGIDEKDEKRDSQNKNEDLEGLFSDGECQYG